MGKAWIHSEEQTTYLQGRFDAYHEVRQNGNIEAFRTWLYKGWAQRWPERQVLFPLWKEGNAPLTQVQMVALGKAIATQKKVRFLPSP